MTEGIAPHPQLNRAGRRAESRRLRKTGALMAAIPAALGTTAMVVGATAGTAGATDYVVMNLNADGADSLHDLAEAAGDGDVITFDASLTGTITLTDDIDIDTSITIIGPGRDVITVSGDDTVGIFNIDAPATDLLDVRISGLTLSDGAATRGAAVNFDYANVALDDVLITGNSASSSGGGIATDAGYDEVLTITNSTISGNTSGYRGGGVYFYVGGSLVIENTEVSGNSAGDGGGGIFMGAERGTQPATATITNSTISGNTSDAMGGGIYAYYLTTVDISGSTVSGNTSLGDGGGGMTLRYIADRVSITGSTISDNSAVGYGGAVYFVAVDGAVTIAGTTIDENHADEGGGAIEWYGSSGTLEIRNSTLSRNSTDTYGGALYLADDGGPVSIFNSTISGNSADSDGGAIWSSSPYGLDIVQSTVALNDAPTVGGIALDHTHDVEAKADRHAEHSAEKAADKIAEGKEAPPAKPADDAPARTADHKPVVLDGTIVALNSGIDIGETGTVQATGSLLGTISGSTFVDGGGNLMGVDPLLGPLQDNGGPTQTHALLDGSPAINAGPDPVATFPGNEDDQRGPGYPRVVGGRVDIGAFEVQPTGLEPTFTG